MRSTRKKITDIILMPVASIVFVTSQTYYIISFIAGAFIRMNAKTNPEIVTINPQYKIMGS